jgi:hypothetical protein
VALAEHVAMGLTGLAAVGGVAVMVTLSPGPPHGSRTEPAIPVRPAGQVTLHTAGSAVPPGAGIHLSRAATGPVEVFLLVDGT